MRGVWIFFIFLALLPTVTAIDQVIINSNDWRDIYTGIVYAQLTGKDAHYVAEKTQGLQLINEVLNKEKTNVLLIESEKPLIFGYQSLLENAGFTVEKYVSREPYETNLEFVQKVAAEGNVNAFVVVDADVGSDAVSVAPYATVARAFVLFASRDNNERIASFLEEHGENILLYGHVDREVKEKLSPLATKIINTGDRYKDNIALVEQFLSEYPTKQVILANGETLEKGFFNHQFPLLLIGSSNVPEQVIDFIQESGLTTGVVIGYDLFSNAKKIRDITGIKILLKYGQGRNSELYALDVFPLAKYNSQIDINSIRYNTLARQLEVTYENVGNTYTVVQALSHIIKSDGTPVAEAGDDQAYLLNEGDLTTVLYDLDLSSYIDSELTVESTVVFGESATSLTKLFIKKNIEVEVVAVTDFSSIDIEKAAYNKNTKSFEITVKNRAGKSVYVDLELVDLIIAGEKATLGGEQQKIGGGKKGAFVIKADLEEADYNDNSRVKVRARYGEQQGILIKVLEKEFPLNFTERSYKPVILLIIIFIILWLIIQKRKLGKSKKR